MIDAAAAVEPAAAPSEAITLTDKALSHLLKLRQERAASAGGQEQQMVFRVSSGRNRLLHSCPWT